MLKPFCIYVTGEINCEEEKLSNSPMFWLFTSVLTRILYREHLLEFTLLYHGWGYKTEEEQSFKKEGQAIRTYQGGVCDVQR